MKKVLIITSSGGGGLIQAAKAKEQEIKLQSPKTIIFTRDMMKEWVWKIIGVFGINSWNRSQKRGFVRPLEWLGYCLKCADYIIWPKVFFHVFHILKKEGIERVIDTQPLGTSAIIRAIRLYNWCRKKNVVLEKMIVDLPTKKSVHFFGGIKRLTRNDKKFLRLISIKPLLEKEKTFEEFWEKHCKISESIVLYEEYPIRQSFKEFMGKSRKKESFSFFVRAKNKEEAKMMEQTFSLGNILSKKMDENFSFTLKKEDKSIFILLGSQPSYEATCNYVKNFIQLVRKKNKKKNYHLFVFCADSSSSVLFRQIYYIANKEKSYPKNLSIIPFSFQKDDVIAPLFFRSDLTITRSGGQSAMELMAIAHGETWVHSEAKVVSNKDYEDVFTKLLKGIPAWEEGNARYMVEKMNSKIVTPDTFSNHCEFLFS